MTTAVPVAHSAHQLPRRADYRLTIDGSQHSHSSVHPGRAGAVGALADYAEGPGFELTATQTTDTYTAYELADPSNGRVMATATVECRRHHRNDTTAR